MVNQFYVLSSVSWFLSSFRLPNLLSVLPIILGFFNVNEYTQFQVYSH